MVYLILFSSALLSATLLPIGSELLLIYDIQSGHHLGLLLLCATLGNVLGSVINYFLGLKGEAYCEKKGYLKAQQVDKYSRFFSRYGGFALLLSWAPIIGDPITFIAGILKYPFKYFLFWVTLAKAGRYIILAYLVL